VDSVSSKEWRKGYGLHKNNEQKMSWKPISMRVTGSIFSHTYIPVTRRSSICNIDSLKYNLFQKEI
jgi:hypothetical protein